MKVKCRVTGREVPDTQWERETVIRWDEGTCELTLYTASPVQARKWERAGVPLMRDARGWQAMVDKREWRIGVGKRRPRVISTEERKRRGERLRQALARTRGSGDS